MKISVNFANICGKIKPMHAVGQPPFKGGLSKIDFSPIGDLRDAYIIDKDHLMTKTESNPKDFVLKENTILLLKNY